MSSKAAVSGPCFSNCLILAPDDTPLSRCGMAKVRWYLSRDMAEVVAEEPLTIRLKFEPRGRSGAADAITLEGKPNHCVVCGSTEELTKHHVVPLCFVRHIRLKEKFDIVRDILPLCVPCHANYELKSLEKREELNQRFGLRSIHGLACNTEEEREEMRRRRKAVCYLRELRRETNAIPPERAEKMRQEAFAVLGVEDLTEDEWNAWTSKRHLQIPGVKTHSEAVAEKVENYGEFAIEWRRHFVETMQPKFLPKSWVVEREPNPIWIPYSQRHLYS